MNINFLNIGAFRESENLFYSILCGISGLGIFLNFILILWSVIFSGRNGPLSCFFIYIGLLDIVNVVLMIPECAFIVQGWSFSAEFCAAFSGIQCFVNVSIAYTILIFGLNVFSTTSKDYQKLGVVAFDDIEDEEGYHEVHEEYFPSARLTDYSTQGSKLFTACSLFASLLLSASISVPYFLLAQLVQGECCLHDNSSLAEALILLLRRALPITLMLLLLTTSLMQKQRRNKNQRTLQTMMNSSWSGNCCSAKSEKFLNVAITYAITFLFFSSARLISDDPHDDYVFAFLTPARLYLTLLHYICSVLRPIFVLSVLLVQSSSSDRCKATTTIDHH